MSALPWRAVTATFCCIMQPLLHCVTTKPAVPSSKIITISNHAVILSFSCYFAQLQLSRLYHPSSMVEAVACHDLNAVTLALCIEYSLCSCVMPCCPTSNALPVRVHCASQLLLQTPLCYMIFHAKSAALCCGRYLDCCIVSFRQYLVVKPVLVGLYR